MVRATSSLPVPLSPVISTEAVLGATSSIRRNTSCILLEEPDQLAQHANISQLAAAGFQFPFGSANADGVLQNVAQAGSD